MPQQDPHSSTDILDPIYKKLAALQAQIDSLQNLSIPTAPSYDSGNFPQDSVEGQIAVGVNDNLFHWFVNGAWRVGGSGIPFANWVATLATDNVTAGSDVHLDGEFFETNDTDVFEMGQSVEPSLNNVLLIKKPGIYTTIAFAAFQVNIAHGDEPGSSVMKCFWDSFNYPASELDTFNWHNQAVVGVIPPGGSRNGWNPWASDTISNDGDIGPPYMEYVPVLRNGGTQPQTVRANLLSIRWSETNATYFP